MAFALKDFQKVGGGAGVQMFTYKTADAIATVKGAGYFNSVSTSLHQFDMIHVVSSVAGTPQIDHALVTSADFAAAVTTV